MKVTIKTDNGKTYTGEVVEEQDEPRVGQICEFWDGTNKVGDIASVLCSVNDPHPRYMDQVGNWWYHAEVLRDPLTLGRTLAPEGAEWIAPWNYDMWTFFTDQPRLGPDGFFDGACIFASHGSLPTFPAPTDGCGPIKLWEE